jgi:hypothetical protein
MNTDGSPGVTVDTRLGARLPSLRWLAIALLAGGGLVLLIGARLLYLGASTSRPGSHTD